MKEIISYQTNSTMKNEEKILELLAESHKGQDRIVARLDVMAFKLGSMDIRQHGNQAGKSGKKNRPN